MNTDRANAVAQELDYITGKGSKVTQEDINETRARVAQRVGPAGVAIFDKFLGPGTTPQNVQARVQLARARLGAQPRTTVPSESGTQDVPTPQADVEAAGGGGGVAGDKNVTVTAPRVGMTSGGPAEQVEQPADVGRTPHQSGAIPGGPATASYKADQEQAANVTERTAPLINALGSLDKLDKDAFGPGSATRNTFKKIIETWGLSKEFGISDNDTKTQAYDKVVKAIHQYNQSISGGGDTDARMYEKIAGNPNADMEKATIKDLLKVNLGLERMRTATINEFSDYQKGGKYGKDWAPSEYDVFKGRFSKGLDQRAFVFDMLTPDKAREFLKSMKPDERKRFDRSLALSDKHIIQAPKSGWYTP